MFKPRLNLFKSILGKHTYLKINLTRLECVTERVRITAEITLIY